MICPGENFLRSPRDPVPRHLRYRTRGRLRAADRREALPCYEVARNFKLKLARGTPPHTTAGRRAE